MEGEREGECHCKWREITKNEKGQRRRIKRNKYVDDFLKDHTISDDIINF